MSYKERLRLHKEKKRQRLIDCGICICLLYALVISFIAYTFCGGV